MGSLKHCCKQCMQTKHAFMYISVKQTPALDCVDVLFPIK